MHGTFQIIATQRIWPVLSMPVNARKAVCCFPRDLSYLTRDRLGARLISTNTLVYQ